jgi:CRP/FNR family transcriptional regulator, anaerobic regulatory protein
MKKRINVSSLRFSSYMMFEKVKAYYYELIPALTNEAWISLEKKFTVQQFKKGEFLIREGDICRYVSFINHGMVRFYYLVEGKEICTGFSGKNEYISEYTSFLTQTPAAMFIEALEDTEVVHLSYNDMQDSYNNYSFFERFGRKIAERLFVMLSSQNTRLLTLTPEQRYQFVVQHQPLILQKVPQYMIASYIGITPEHLSRIRKKLSDRTS